MAQRSWIRREVMLGTAAAALGSLSRQSFSGEDPAGIPAGKPTRVLVFSGTNWYRHPEIPQCNGWLVRILGAACFDVDVTETPADLTKEHLAGYELFVMNNCNELTTLLTAQQRQAIEDCYKQGKGIVALVMEERSDVRPTRILERGQYDKPGAEVHPNVPAAILAWPSDAPRNRLGFARWLVAPDNPLTARVAVNRLWKQCFGEGLVRTVNDFGTQGEQPTHPELLDFLAARFRDSGWDVKGMLRLIVTSDTYRQQSSLVVRDGEVVDPENRWLSRGARFRLPMEMIRDQALAASGLLVPRLGGPSVKPYQPPGLWEEVSYNGEESYEPDRGEGLWRRSLYTYIKRQAPPPALLLFDGPTREKCTVRRARTNTPLQALVLLNDETYVEAARHLATACCTEAASDEERLTWLMIRILSRRPQAEELRQLTGLLDRQRKRFAVDPAAAAQLLAVGETMSSGKSSVAETASWTLIAHTLLNLDEAVTRR